MGKLNTDEKKVASLIQFDIPLVSRPFREIGEACGLGEEDVLNITRALQQEGYIRRFCAILRHQKAGYKENALVVWSVPPQQTQKAGETLAAFSFVSHCYAREPAFKNKYNLFTMLHTQNENMAAIIAEMAQAIKSRDFLILKSLQEYKKISPEYF